MEVATDHKAKEKSSENPYGLIGQWRGNREEVTAMRLERESQLGSGEVEQGGSRGTRSC